jgi:N-acetyl-anhydromuramyl-L-alanine amidase AmpD
MRSSLLGCFALALLFGCGSLSAQSRLQSDDVDPAFQARVNAEQSALAKLRVDYPALFAAAYARYPEIPTGTLEAIAHVQTRWVHLQAAPHKDHAPESATAIGLMGLYAGDGFSDQVGEAAALLGVARGQIESDPYWNVMAAAALLSAKSQRSAPALSEAQLLQAYAGFGKQRSGDRIDAFARESFAFDVLLSIDRGVDDHGVLIKSRPIDWEAQFDVEALSRQRAPFVRLDLKRGTVEADGYRIDTLDESLRAPASLASAQAKSTDYGPALWVASPYYHSRGTAATAVTIHTMQGSYAGSISWFKSNPYSVSAHYLIRSSDGQITQMVRESSAAHHVGSENNYTLGIEHEGYVNNAAWYTTAMYNASAALTRHFCSRYGISCASAYSGPAHSGVVVLSSAIRIKGHQHFPNNTHTDPGINWSWSRYYSLLNPGAGGGTTRILDTFESNEGHFTSTPSYSGSTTGISANSTAVRDCAMSRVGSCSEHLTLIDNSANSSAWSVRFLSGGGAPASNTSFSRNGRIGFWVFVAGSGFSVGVGIDDSSDGTERSTLRAVNANTWTYVEWDLSNAAQWNTWVGGNGTINSANVTLDAIWLERAHTTYTVNVHLDEVQWRPN